MSWELVYTSAPKGLRPGSSGFCTVAATAGLSVQASARMESLSGYEFHFALSDPRAEQNPANYAHTRIRADGEQTSVLSCVAFGGADHTGRSNVIAHHFGLSNGERGPAGPAAMLFDMAKAGRLRRSWRQAPKILPAADVGLYGTEIVARPSAAGWQRLTGDAGWAAGLVRAIREDAKLPAFVIYEPGTDVLSLFAESLALLPPENRWDVEFATYYTATPSGCNYHWRGILAGSPATREISRYPGATVIDLTKPLGKPVEDDYTRGARDGRIVGPPSPKARTSTDGDPTCPPSAATPGGYAWEGAMSDQWAGIHQKPLRGAGQGRYAGRLKVLSAGLAVVAFLLVVTNIVTISMWSAARQGDRTRATGARSADLADMPDGEAESPATTAPDSTSRPDWWSVPRAKLVPLPGMQFITRADFLSRRGTPDLRQTTLSRSRDGQLVFDLDEKSKAYSFCLDVPPSLANYLTIRQSNGCIEFWGREQAQDVRLLDVRFTRKDDRPVLLWQAEPGLAEEAWRYLVVEAIQQPTGRKCQFARIRHVSDRAEDRVVVNMDKEPEFPCVKLTSYPWPAVLQLRLGSPDVDAPPGEHAARLVQGSFSFTLRQNSIEVESRPLRDTCHELNTLWDEWRQPSAQGARPTASPLGSESEPESGRAMVAQELKRITKRLDELGAELEANGSVSAYDPWGIPVMIVQLKMILPSELESFRRLR